MEGKLFFRYLAILSFVVSFLPIVAQADATGSMFSPEIRREAQEALNFYGFDAGTPDGVFGPGTRRAIAAYQSANGGTPTGEFSRAVIGNLLQSYRAEKVVAPANATSEMPQEVVSIIGEFSGNCGVASSSLISKPGFLQQADLNGDGAMDYLIDGSAAGCFEMCGASNCQVNAVVSSPAGYQSNSFLGYSITPNTFLCNIDGVCEFSGL